MDLDGALVEFQMYALRDDDGNPTNYIKIRDLGQKLGFNVRWDEGRGLVCVESDRPYTG